MRSLVALSLLVCLAACRTEDGGALVLNITAAPELSVQSLSITLSAGGRSKLVTHQVTGGKLPPALQFAVQIPPSALGEVSVSVSGGSLTAAGVATVRATETATLSLTLKPTAQSDALTVAPTEIAFGKIATTQKSAATLVTVKNTAAIASSTLTVMASSAVFEISADNCSDSALPANATCTFRVAFVPAMNGDATGTITISNASLSVSGTGYTPGALASADSPFDFGTILSTGTASKTFTVQNNGGVASGNLVTTAIAGGNADQFSTTSDTCNGASLAPSATCTITIKYQPTMQGSHSAHLDISSPAAGDLTLSWTGVSQAPTLTLNPPTHTFEDVKVGGTSADFSYTVTNSGASSVGPLAITPTAPFNYKIESTCNGKTLDPGDSCTVIAFFQPTAAGVFSDVTIVIAAPNLAASLSLLATGAAYSCDDADGDGYFVDSKHGTYVNGRCSATAKLDDCSDADADNWDKCATCLDTDGDGFFVGCNRFFSRYAECDATANDANKWSAFEEIGGADLDCDGRTLTVDDDSGIFVTPGGLDTNPGTKSFPVLTIAHAISLTTPQRQAIFVSGGAYADLVENISSIHRRVGVFGGFVPAANWTRDIVGAESTIEPASVAPTMTIGAQAVRLDGITHHPSNGIPLGGNPLDGETILDVVDSKLLSGLDLSSTTKKGRASVVRSTIGHMLKASGSSVDLSDCQLNVESGDPAAGHPFGGVVAEGDATITISRSAIDATVYSGAPGVLVGHGTANSGVLLDQVDLKLNNSAGSRCVGISQQEGSLIANRTTIHGCVAPSVVGIEVAEATLVRISSSVVDAGTFTGGDPQGTSAGIHFNAVGPNEISNAKLLNSLIVLARDSPTMEPFSGGVIRVGNLVAPTGILLANNIVVMGGSVGAPIHLEDGGMGTVTPLNNSLTGGSAPIRQGTTAGTINSCTGLNRCTSPSGNISAACPVDASYHLLASSPCKSVGYDATTAPVSLPAFTDIDGVARPIGSWDIGPDEVADSF